MKRNAFHMILMLALFGLFGTACDSTTPEADFSDQNDEDVAASVAVMLEAESGGLIDQVGDVIDLAASLVADSSGAPAEKGAGSTVTKTYDDAAQRWTITIERSWTSPDTTRHAEVFRKYQVQFLNADGDPQQYYVTDGAMAHSLHFTIVEGNGVFNGPHVDAERTSLSGNWMVTGVNTDTITINGTYGRSGSHTFRSETATRTLQYEAEMEVIDLVGPRGSRLDLSEKVSGTVIGKIEGIMTHVTGDRTTQHEVSREISVVIDGGEAVITINGETFQEDLQPSHPGLLGPPLRS